MRPTFLSRPQFGPFISMLICGALLVSMFAGTPRSSAKAPRNTKTTTQSLNPQGNSQRQREPAPRDNGRRVDPVPPQTGPPAANLPNLDELKQRKIQKPEAPAPVPSKIRSPRKANRRNANRTAAGREPSRIIRARTWQTGRAFPAMHKLRCARITRARWHRSHKRKEQRLSERS